VELNGAVSAVGEVIGEMSGKIAPYKAAAKVLRGQESIALMNDVKALEAKLKDLQLMLNGDRDRGQLDLDAEVSLRDRAGIALYGLFGNFSEVPGSAKQQYEIAAEEFRPLYLKTREVMKDFEGMDEKLGRMGAPLTPGRLPDWK